MENSNVCWSFFSAWTLHAYLGVAATSLMEMEKIFFEQDVAEALVVRDHDLALRLIVVVSYSM